MVENETAFPIWYNAIFEPSKIVLFWKWKKLSFGLIILILEKRNFSIHYENSFWFQIRVTKCAKSFAKIISSKLNSFEIFTRTFPTSGWVRSRLAEKIWTRKPKICRRINRASRFFKFIPSVEFPGNSGNKPIYTFIPKLKKFQDFHFESFRFKLSFFRENHKNDN